MIASPPVVTDRPSVGLVVGRDPAGTTWLDVRRAEGLAEGGWTDASLTDLTFDPGRQVLELSPVAPAALAGSGRLPIEIVTDVNGQQYRSRPSKHLVQTRIPGGEWAPLRCFGGRGHAVGQLRRPAGLALDGRGRLYVADSGNHRVQVVRLHDSSVLDTLGPIEEPVDVAIDPGSGRIAVADRAGGRIHIFSVSFAPCGSFEPAPSLARPDGVPPRPIALAWRADGTLLVADANHPRLLHLDASGTWLGEVSLAGAQHARFEGLALNGSYAAEGELVLGPLDSGLHGVGWHDVRLELELAPGTSVEVQTWATDEPTTPPDPARWAPDLPVPVGGSEGFESVRLIAADGSEWSTWMATDRTTPPPRGTDRGRYLWVRIRFIGARARADLDRAIATPSLHALRLRFPRPSYLSFLPSHWSRREDADRPGALYVERFLALFERVLTDTEASLEGMPRLLSVDTAPSGWLEWIASWLALSFDPSWPESRRRALLAEAMSLYRKRGTVSGLIRYLEIYTGSTPVIVEGFTTRTAHRPLLLGDDGALGCARLDATSDSADAQAHRFTAYVHLDDPERHEVVQQVVRRILDTEKPAHTDYDLVMVLPDARLGPQSTVGIDLVLGHGQSADAICNDFGPTEAIRLGGPRSPLLDEAGIAVGDVRLT